MAVWSESANGSRDISIVRESPPATLQTSHGQCKSAGTGEMGEQSNMPKSTF